jgi:predicted RNA-binding protein YlqC (UPF0109 family)
MQLEELLRNIISKIVDKPSEIEIDTVPGEHTTIIKWKVAKEDTGKVIGKQGRTADAIRTILKSIGGKLSRKVILEIKDTYTQEPQ